ncbi:MAG: EVE domain-containing protein [Synechococcales bacterium]|nr:EVE domain-containing protein [Synechococcales bacterium]
MKYWLMKSEPDVYSITDLKTEGETIWDGVRNYQARNFLRAMAVGDRAFFYHSNTKPPGIAGLMEIVQPDLTDPTQFDPKSKYYDSKSPPDNPRWQTVRVAFVQAFPDLLTLETLREQFDPEQLWILRRGNRLSVIPVEAPVAEKILALATALSPAP